MPQSVLRVSGYAGETTATARMSKLARFPLRPSAASTEENPTVESMIDKTSNPPARLVDLATAIDAEHRQAHASFRACVAHALEAGRLLMAAKAAVAHGEWLPWLAANTEVSERTAQAYMRLARELPELDAEKAQRVSDLPLRDALAVLSETREDREKAEYGGYALHEVCRLKAPMGERQLGRLVDSIREVGLLQPILLCEGRILDGKNRVRACIAAGVEPEFTEYTGSSPLAAFWAVNAMREPYTPAERASFATA